MVTTLKLFAADGQPLTNLESLDPWLCLPTEIQLQDDGRLSACYGDQGPFAYGSLEALCQAYALPLGQVQQLVEQARQAAAARPQLAILAPARV